MHWATRLIRLRHRFEGWLHARYARDMLLSMGQGVVLDPSVRFRYPHSIAIGERCRLYEDVILVGKPGRDPGIVLGPLTKVHERAILDAYSGRIFTGKNAFIGHMSVVCGHGGLSIGDNTLISGLCYIIPANHIFESDQYPLRFQGETRRGIVIGANVWIGAGCTILDGVTIGDNVVVGGGSVVASDLPAWSVAVGVPARVIRMRQRNSSLELS